MENNKEEAKKIEEMEFETVDEKRITAEVIFRELVKAQSQVAQLQLTLAAKNREQILLPHSADMKKFIAGKSEIITALNNQKSDVEWLKKQFIEAKGEISKELEANGSK